MTKYNLRRIDLYCPQYETDAVITVDEGHPSGQPHLAVRYKEGGYEGDEEFASAIPADWTDQDLGEVIFLQINPRPGRNWPTWEVAARDYGSASLFRWWKGENPPK